MRKILLLVLVIGSGLSVLSVEAAPITMTLESNPAGGVDRDAWGSPLYDGYFGMNYGYWLTVGCNNANAFGYRTVTKFDLSSLTGEVSASTLQLRIDYVESGTRYIGIEHFAENRPDVWGDNDGSVDGALTKSDLYATSNVERVGVYTATQLSWLTADVTGFVKADQAAGYDFSTFRYYLADANGNELVSGGACVQICSQDHNPGLGPQLTVTTVPEPCTLGLLAFAAGFAGLRRRK